MILLALMLYLVVGKSEISCSFAYLIKAAKASWEVCGKLWRMCIILVHFSSAASLALFMAAKKR